MDEKQMIIEYGRKCKTKNLIEQAAYTCELAQEALASLADAGLTQDAIDECLALKDEIVDLEGKQESAKDTISISTVSVYDQVDEAKKWIKLVKLKAWRAFRLNKVVLDDFFNHPVLGRSVPNCIATLAKLIELQIKFDSELGAFGGGSAFAEEGKNILAALQEIDSQQEVNKTNLPASTQELYYKQGMLYLKIKDINDMAQEAFIDDRVKARNYTMKILNRGGAKRKVVESV